MKNDSIAATTANETRAEQLFAPEISVILVSYGSEPDVFHAVKSVPSSVEVVVVEQHHESPAARKASALHPHARLVNAGANRGFGAGCNLGAANASGEILVFLNPDATLEPGALAALQHTLSDRNVGVAGPRVLDASGDEDTRARNWSSPQRDALHLILPKKLIPKRWSRDIPANDKRYVEGGPVPYIQGSCMAIRRETFFAVGGFDEEFFLYGEEEDLARRLAASGLTCALSPDSVIRHSGQTTTSSVALFATEQLFRSHALGYSRRRGPLYAGFGSLVVALALGLLWITSPIRALTPYRNLETPAWCRAAASGLAAGVFRRRPQIPTTVSSPALGAAQSYWSLTPDPGANDEPAPTTPNLPSSRRS